MPLEIFEAETSLLIQAFAKSREQLYSDGQSVKLAPFGHVHFPENVPIGWQPYTSMLNDFLEYIANEINLFGYQIGQLQAWSKVLPLYEVEEQMILLMEFIDSIASSATSAPYAIRSRLIFCSTKLNYEAGLMTGRSENSIQLPPDNGINYKAMVRNGDAWSNFDSFKQAVEDLNDESAIAETFDFRNKYHHRIPPRIELGQPWIVSRTRDEATKSTVYGYGHSNPLGISSLLTPLRRQHESVLSAFSKFSALAEEHVSFIPAA